MKTPTHINALRVLDAVIRHRSFSIAAKELNVTPAAVGQQIRSLESILGVQLFIRPGGTGKLEYTSALEGAVELIQLGFENLTIAWEKLKASSASEELTVTVSALFAAKWILPRIQRFQESFPSVKLLLDTNESAVNVMSERLEIGVRYGRGAWKGVISEYLMDEVMFPVCSPNFEFLEGGKLTYEGLLRSVLIHDVSMGDDPDYPNWRMWMDASGYEDVDTSGGVRINNAATVVQAAVDGRGVALARSVMVKEDLDAGRLIRPFADKGVDCPLTQAYYIVYHPAYRDLPKVRVFRDWLVEEARTI